MFFDAATTRMRAGLVSRAIAVGKYVYCEQPIADTLDKAVAVARFGGLPKLIRRGGTGEPS